jgi:hypothetical protein
MTLNEKKLSIALLKEKLETLTGRKFFLVEDNIEKQQRYPSEEFDQKYRTHFSKKWNLPKGIDENKLGALVDNLIKNNTKKSADIFFNLFSQVILLNPELKEINIFSGHDASTLIYGIASRFNLDDIKFFIEDWLPSFGSSLRGDVNYRNMRDRIATQYNLDLNWVPSPITLEKIKIWLGGKQKPEIVKKSKVSWSLWKKVIALAFNNIVEDIDITPEEVRALSGEEINDGFCDFIAEAAVKLIPGATYQSTDDFPNLPKKCPGMHFLK